MVKVNGLDIDIGSKLRVLITRYIFVGEVVQITEYNEIILKDIKNTPITFKPKDTKFIQVLSEEEYEAIKEKYVKKS